MKPLQEFNQPPFRILPCSLLLFIAFHAQASSPQVVMEEGANCSAPRYDTSRKDPPSYFDHQARYRLHGKIPFFGVWADYFSSCLRINKDSTFRFSWGYDLKGSWTVGKWMRQKDTFYFRGIPIYDTLRQVTADGGVRDSLVLSHYPKPGIISQMPTAEEPWLSVQNAYPFPEKLYYFKSKLLLIDSNGIPSKGRLVSPYMRKTVRTYKTFYFREKRFNLDFFDSAYYNKLKTRRFSMGFGLSGFLQPEPGYRVVASAGFTVSPRYIIYRKMNSSITLGIPLTTGFTRYDDSTRIDYAPGVVLDLPIIVNYNYKPASAGALGSRLSYFAGAGFAYHYMKYTAARAYATTNREVSGVGPQANIGIRLSSKTRPNANMELRLSYMKMIADSKSSIFGLGYIINF